VVVHEFIRGGRAGCALALLAALLAAGCLKGRKVDPLQLDGNLLTAVNQSEQDWNDVEIWINRQFRVTAPTIAASQAFRAPLDHFVTGYGQRFNFSRMQIRDVRLNARRPDGTAVEIRKQFEGDALSDVLKGMGGQR
jgi:hypothetical protein